MVKRKQSVEYTPSRRERLTLAACSGLMITFFLFVAIATGGSLSFYVTPFAVVAVFVFVAFLAANALPRLFVRAVIVIGIIGVAAALWLLAAYLPMYASYLDYMRSIKG